MLEPEEQIKSKYYLDILYAAQVRIYGRITKMCLFIAIKPKTVFEEYMAKIKKLDPIKLDTPVPLKNTIAKIDVRI